MNAYLTHVVNYLLNQSWQIAFLTVVVILITFLLRNKNAHVRYLIWLVVLAKCLIPPLYAVPISVLPQELIEVRSSGLEPIKTTSESQTIAVSTSDLSVTGTEPANVQMPVFTEPTVSMEVTDASKWTWAAISTWLGIIWILGVVVYLVVNVLKAMGTRRWLKRERHPLEPKMQKKVSEFFGAQGIKRLPKIWAVEDASQPFVWGLLSGSIYIPADLLNVDSLEKQRNVLAHELSHTIRYDAAVNLLQVIAQTIFWFHPLVWWANLWIRREREKCCDEMAIAGLKTSPKDYTRAIVEALATDRRSAHSVPSLAIVGSVKNIEERIKTMLRPGKKFYKRPSVIVLTIVLLLALVIVPIGCVLTNRGEAQTATNQKKRFSSLYEATKAGDLAEVKRLITEGADVNVFNKDDNMTPLGFAAENGLTEIAKVLLENGANADLGDSRIGNTPLILAILDWNAEIVNTLIDNGANVNLTNYVDADDPPLFYAINEDRADFVKALLDAGANPRLKSGSGQSLLKLAVEFCNPDVVKLLINADDDVSELHKAALRGDILRLQSLLNEGADINIPDEFGITPIEYALAAGQNDMVNFFIENGVDLNRNSSWMGRSILHLAARAGLIDIVQILIDREVPLDTLSAYGTPLHEAAMGGHKDIVELLLSEGIPIDSADRSGRTPLYRAIYKNHVDIVQLLIDKGTDVNPSGYSDTPLYIASINGYAELANLLRQNGAKMTMREAVTLSDVDEVKNLVSQGADINEESALSTNNLHIAARNGNREIVELLIDEGADVNAKTSYNITPLHYAVENGHKEIVELLLANGADLSIKRNTLISSGFTALHDAVDLGQIDIVELLIAGGADVNVLTDSDVSPLYIAELKDYEEIANLLRKNGAEDISPTLYGAFENGDIEQIKLLISQGADINVKINRGQTLLHMASERGDKEIAELLIENGADINAKNNAGGSSLHSAVMSGHKNIVELFIEAGADVNIISNSGDTPLDIAQGRGQNEIVELLLSHSAGRSLVGAISSGDIEEIKRLISEGVDLNVTSGLNQSPLHMAIERGNKEVVELLIENGADVNIVSNVGTTPLDIAQEIGNTEIAELLLEHSARRSLVGAISSGDIEEVKRLISEGVDVNPMNQFGESTPIFNAALAGNLPIVELLIENGADVNAKNITGMTPLHLACQSGHELVVEFLIESGADVNVINQMERTPLDLAEERGYSEIVELLREHGATE
ncbi:ankyrin repeat domain-containing protein [Planctomycetota bacterium]